MTTGTTFAMLAMLEPRLNDLLAEACAHRRDRRPGFCANAVWYGYGGHKPSLKTRLHRLVGWGSGQCGLLRTEEAYDVAYLTLYQALPDCRGRCACAIALGA